MAIDPLKTVLLVIDMQSDFYADGGNAALRGKPVEQMQALPAKIDAFATKLRAGGAKIVFTKFIYDPTRTPQNYSDIVGEIKNSNWMCRANTPGAELSEVHPAKDDAVIEKFSYDCFAGTDLLQRCKEWGTDTIIIAGVRTEICVTHTACRSFAEGFRTIIMSDLVGTYDNKREMAAAVLDALRYSCYVMSSADAEQALVG